MKHTAGTWLHNGKGTIHNGQYTIAVVCGNGLNAFDNAERIVDCVNACRGIPDPQQAITAAREALEFYARMGDDVVYRDQVEFDNGHKAAAALAALKGEQP